MDLKKLCAVTLLIATTACSPAAAPTLVPPQSQPAPINAPLATVTPAGVPTTQNSSSAPSTTAPTGAVTISLIPGKNEARYRVREQLAGVNLPSDAVGVTKDISGTIIAQLDGTILPPSNIRVNLTALKSNDNRRDNFVQQNVLATRNFPNTQFVPRQAKGLPAPLPSSGNLKFQLIGDLTIRDVTKSVTWDVAGNFDGNQGTGTATCNFNFAYFNLVQPRVPMVLSIEDNIKLEIDVALAKQ
jgi:polyisoprenoid-binding protein YceI